jgi:hypothetical protein
MQVRVCDMICSGDPIKSILSVTFSTICPSHAPCLRKTKSGNSKPCSDYIFRTASKYKRKFTPNFKVSPISLSLSLSLPLSPSLLSQISNLKNPTKIGVFLLKKITFQPLINIQWMVSSISLCMEVNFPVFFLLH